MEREIIEILNRDSAKQCKKCKKKATVVCSGCSGNVFCGSDCAIGHQLICGGGGKRKVEEFQSLPGPNADANAARFAQLFQVLRDNPIFMRNMLEEITTEQISNWRLASRIFNQYLGQNAMFWFMLVQIKYPRLFHSKNWNQDDERWIELGKHRLYDEEMDALVTGIWKNIDPVFLESSLGEKIVIQKVLDKTERKLTIEITFSNIKLKQDDFVLYLINLGSFGNPSVWDWDEPKLYTKESKGAYILLLRRLIEDGWSLNRG